MNVKLFLILAALAVFPSISPAMEVYRFILKNCDTETGLVISADQTHIGLVDVSGRHVYLQRDEIATILAYNSVVNPIQEVHLRDELQQMLVDIHVDEAGEPLFTGWAIRFVDDLVFFFGLDGKPYALDIHKIITIENASRIETPLIRTEVAKAVEFGYGRNFPECAIKVEKYGDADVLQPMRILGDQIKIEKWFLNYQKGFRRLERYKQRTLFYAKPRLYKDQSRIGAYRFLGKEGGVEEEPEEMQDYIPAFFHWSGGKPYSYQHQSWVGSKPSQTIPQAEPVFAFSSDIKAHLFHGSFIIAINNPVPGYPTLISRAQGQSEYFNRVIAKDTFVFTQFNYMAFTGIDYGQSSYSGGFFYPIFAIQTGGKQGFFREVLASESSPAIRYRYTMPNFKIRVLYAYTDYQIDNPSSKELAMYPSSWLQSGQEANEETFEEIKLFTRRYVEDFSLTNHYLRLGFDWDITTEVRFGMDEIILDGMYHETLHDAEDTSAPTYNNSVDYRHFITSIYLRHQFDGRVAISAYLNHYNRNHQSRFLGIDNETNESEISFFTIFEFLL